MNLIFNPDVIHDCSNCQTWWTWVEQPQIHARTMKMRQKLENINLSSYERISLLDHNEISPIQFRWVFHEIQSKISFSQSRWKISLMRFDGWKSWKLDGKMLLCVRMVWEDYVCLLEKFHTLHTLRWKEKSSNSLTILFTLTKFAQTLTLTLFLLFSKA